MQIVTISQPGRWPGLTGLSTTWPIRRPSRTCSLNTHIDRDRPPPRRRERSERYPPAPRRMSTLRAFKAPLSCSWRWRNGYLGAKEPDLDRVYSNHRTIPATVVQVTALMSDMDGAAACPY